MYLNEKRSRRRGHWHFVDGNILPACFSLAATLLATVVAAQPPLLTTPALADDFPFGSSMGQVLAASGERLAFSSATGPSTSYYLLRAAPVDSWTGAATRSLAADEQQFAGDFLDVGQVFSWSDGGAPFADSLLFFGCREVLAIQANRLVKGCPSGLSDRGEVSIFRSQLVRGSGPVWIEERYDTGTAVGGRFGAALAYDATTVVIGEPHNLSGQTGKVHIRRLVSGDWLDFGTLQAPDGELDNAFGAALALVGDWLAVGAPLDDAAFPEPSAGSNVGTVHLYRRGGIGNLFFLHFGTLYGSNDGDKFGTSIAMTASTLVIGAPRYGSSSSNNIGRAYVYWRSGEEWIAAARLGASGPVVWDEFGTTVGILDHGVVVGARGRDGTNTNSGAVYYFPGLTAVFLDGFESGDTDTWSNAVP